jgi:hypothetical protein
MAAINFFRSVRSFAREESNFAFLRLWWRHKLAAAANSVLILVSCAVAACSNSDNLTIYN